MKVTPDPQDRDLTLGAPIRSDAPKPPDVVKPFEAVPHELADPTSAIESIVETLRKKSGVTVEPGHAEDWEGMCIDPYTAAILGCI